ncbi:BolA/IbaG family iron-sulfur metabolism protein [Thiotrichales bacterium 19S3-7]|nr:BolA/IbaG family iron-sulfur metabolism protein [Thiotrichales bacterium 19S3-7]MCF6801008.1 BolA/IbaG family iron-sulfur metabolism protein [Thiotrichales bacterium 19S3-11]
MDAIKLRELIENNLENTKALVQSDDNVHFEAVVISKAFEDMISKVKQQQLVYQVLNDYIRSGEIHAIALKTYTPKQWHALNNE